MTEQAFPPHPSPSPWPFTWTPVTQDQFTTAATHIDRRLAAIEKAVHDIRSNMATQADVDALTAALVAEDAELNTAVSSLQASVAAIAALLAVPPAQLDIAALQAEVATSQTLADAVQAAVASAAALVPPATS